MRQKLILLLAILLPTSMSALPPFEAGWVDSDIHHHQGAKPSFRKDAFSCSAWRGERVSAMALVWAHRPVQNLSVSLDGLKCRGSRIPSSSLSASFVSPVTGDMLAEQYNQCGKRDTVNWAPVHEADLIGYVQRMDMVHDDVQPIWVSIEVPSDAVPGVYSGTLTINCDGAAAKRLPLRLRVSSRELPPSDEWPFHLDLWQNPYAVARVAGVPLWSKEHFDAMTPVFRNLARAGQKVVTATLMDRPWNGQTEDPFGPMVTKVLRADGSWTYDYTVFDMWVEYMESLGIDSQINCYTMIPWKLSFDYFDQASYSVKYVDCAPGSSEYSWYWGNFIADFASHLRSKGWFEKTFIAMDERGEEAMRKALDLIHGIEPEFKVALAGSYHESLASEISDLCIAFMDEYPEGVVASRRQQCQISTYYTCCAEGYPNTFIASSPAEAVWLPLVALAKDVDGYLRWAFNSWTLSPFYDARFRSWAGGDTYMVYPDGLTGVRFEKLLEGLQLYEKTRLLLEEYDGSPQADALKKAVSRFNYPDITDNGPLPALSELRTAIGSCE